MTTFAYDVSFIDNNWTAQIYRDNALSIRQQINHKNGLKFNSELDAKSWAEEHVSELEQNEYLQQESIKKIQLLERAALVNSISQAISAKEKMPDSAQELDAFINDAIQELNK